LYFCTGAEIGLSYKGETQIKCVREQAMKRIFGPKKDEIIGGWTKSHKEGIHNLYTF
jgi:hypothetical protein